MNTKTEKANVVREMFSGIAHRYDFLNHFLSLGLDILWRNKTVALLGDLDDKKVLDVACGTGDLSIELANSSMKVTVAGLDFSKEMVDIGVSKVATKNLENQIHLAVGDALNIKHSDDSFDFVTCAFGVRNFVDLDRGLIEMIRVLKPGGRMAILEFTTPKNKFFAFCYGFYFTRILPVIGGFVSGKRFAYNYLPDSVYRFPGPEKITGTLEELGLGAVRFVPLTFGVCGVHTGVKR